MAQLIELYTSQGCSSCPPAERRLNALSDHPELWTRVVPLAFHVDYWDRLGWRDPFASQANTRRQYALSESGQVASVYTPCFVVNGREWKGYFSGEEWPKEARSAGVLEARIRDGRLVADYSEGKEGRELNVAIVGVGLETYVERGENRKRLLEQDFVTLWSETNDADWTVELPDLSKLKEADRYAVATWVTALGSFAPLQATGAWLSE